MNHLHTKPLSDSPNIFTILLSTKEPSIFHAHVFFHVCIHHLNALLSDLLIATPQHQEHPCCPLATAPVYFGTILRECMLCMPVRRWHCMETGIIWSGSSFFSSLTRLHFLSWKTFCLSQMHESTRRVAWGAVIQGEIASLP